MLRFFHWLLAPLFAASGLVMGAPPSDPVLSVKTTFADRDIQPSTAFYRINDTESVALSRISFLLSNISFLSAEGEWISPEAPTAFLEPTSNIETHQLGTLPEGNYKRIRFQLGLDKAVDLSDPAKHPADHPLNPNINGLHWGMADSGFVYLAVEGRRRLNSGETLGLSYHLATELALTQYELPIEIVRIGTTPQEITLHLQMGALFDEISPSVDGTSTHSQPEDRLASRLVKNLPGLFTSATVREGNRMKAESARELPASNPDAKPLVLGISPLLPRIQPPRDNPLTEEGVALGERLFHEAKLSGNDSVSCASCHQSDYALGDATKTSLGIDGKKGTRNAMPLFNLAWKPSLFWDGRTERLRDLIFEPWTNPEEMGGVPEVDTAQLKEDEQYRKDFANAFRDGRVSQRNISLALEQFLLTQVSQHSRFDEVIRGRARFSPEEQRGYELFHLEYDPANGKLGADCFHCHGGLLFTNHKLHNNGLDSIDEAKDLGRGSITENPADYLLFSTPSLRNLKQTAPYMHDGRFETIRDVIEHYNSGVVRSDTLDPNLSKHPETGLNLSEQDKNDLEAFLLTLTEE